MRAVIHVGMPKTGSSSIQEAFHGVATPSLETLAWTGINHYPMLLLLYGSPESGHHVFWPTAPGKAVDLDGKRAALKAGLEAQIRRLAATDATLLVTAEALWAARRSDIRAALLADLSPHARSVEAIAYVRPPLSFAASVFQQRLKHLPPPPALDLRKAWPRYAGAMRSLDAQFGRDNVRLRPFRREALAGGDVVLDFAGALGVEPPPRGVGAARANESLSLEATSLLYVQRRFGEPFALGHRQSVRHMAAFLAALRPIGSRRLTFAPALVRPIREAEAEDIAAAEARLGASLAEAPDDRAVPIASEEDLVAVALDARAALRDRLLALGVEAPRGPDPRTETIALLDALKRACAGREVESIV